MSDRANRSFEKITRNDLKHLCRLAFSNFEDFFKRNPEHPYHGRLRLIYLLQTAAKHYIEPDQCRSPHQTEGGVNDFDICGFFETMVGRHLYPQRKCNVDFGPSKFGRNSDDGERFEGRRVDVMWRDIPREATESPASARRNQETGCQFGPSRPFR
jgi:hypothetical protein